MESGWKIWFHRLDRNGKIYASGVLPYSYQHKASAVRRAKKHFGGDTDAEWCISKVNPYPTHCRNCGKTCSAQALLNAPS